MALSAGLKEALNHAFAGTHNSGPKCGPGKHAMRLLLVDGLEAGLTEDEVKAFLNPGFFRGINDPYGGGALIDDLGEDELHALASYAAGCETTNARVAEERFFDAFPHMRERYIELAG